MKQKKTIKSHPKQLSLAAPPSETEYEADFFKWTKCQANFLKKRQLDKLDIENLIEEIESLGRSDKRALRSLLNVLLVHLLKKKFQPEGQGNSNSWDSSIFNSTKQIQYLLQESPSLKSELKKMYQDVYEDARHQASFETTLEISIFPEKCPWLVKELFPNLEKKYDN